MIVTSWILLFLVCGHAARRCDFKAIGAKSGNLKVESFDRAFRGKQPVIFRNLTSTWPARTLWASKDSFVGRYGHLIIGLREQVALGSFETAKLKVSIKEYLNNDAYRNYIQFDFGNHDLYRAVHTDYRPVPDALRRISASPAFSLGRNGTGSGGHRHDENWLAQVAGRKNWVVAPPNVEGLSQVVQPCDLWNSKEAWPKGIISCLMRPGEVLYLPRAWYHATCNLDDFTLAVGGRGSSHWPEFIHDIRMGDIDALKNAAQTIDVVRPVHYTDAKGQEAAFTPLHMAIEVGALDVVKFLVRKRADPKDIEHGVSAVIAATYSRVDILKYLIQQGLAKVTDKQNGRTPLHMAAAEGHLETVNFLLSVRSNVHEQAGPQSHAVTALHVAAASDSHQVIAALLDHGADVDAVDQFGKPATSWAAAHKAVAALKQLRDRGASLDVHADGQSLLHVAAKKGHPDVLDFLLNNSLKVDTRDRSGAFPIHHAAAAGHLECVKVLLRSRALLKGSGAVKLQASNDAVAKLLKEHKEALQARKSKSRKKRKEQEEL